LIKTILIQSLMIYLFNFYFLQFEIFYFVKDYECLYQVICFGCILWKMIYASMMDSWRLFFFVFWSLLRRSKAVSILCSIFILLSVEMDLMLFFGLLQW